MADSNYEFPRPEPSPTNYEVTRRKPYSIEPTPPTITLDSTEPTPPTITLADTNDDVPRPEISDTNYEFPRPEPSPTNYEVTRRKPYSTEPTPPTITLADTIDDVPHDHLEAYSTEPTPPTITLADTNNDIPRPEISDTNYNFPRPEPSPTNYEVTRRKPYSTEPTPPTITLADTIDNVPHGHLTASPTNYEVTRRKPYSTEPTPPTITLADTIDNVPHGHLKASPTNYDVPRPKTFEDLVSTMSVYKPATFIDHADRLFPPNIHDHHQLQPWMPIMSSPLAQANGMTTQMQAVTAAPENALARLATSTDLQTTGTPRSQSARSISFLDIFSVYLQVAFTIASFKLIFRILRERVHDLLTFLGLKKKEESTETSVINILETTPKDLNLSELPPEVEDSLVMLLDVEYHGQQVTKKDAARVLAGHRIYKYGWQKICQEFEIPIEILRYLELKYKQDNGSPTKELFELLGSQGKTVSELTSVLQRPTVIYSPLVVALEDFFSLIQLFASRSL